MLRPVWYNGDESSQERYFHQNNKSDQQQLSFLRQKQWIRDYHNSLILSIWSCFWTKFMFNSFLLRFKGEHLLFIRVMDFFPEPDYSTIILTLVGQVLYFYQRIYTLTSAESINLPYTLAHLQSTSARF